MEQSDVERLVDWLVLKDVLLDVDVVREVVRLELVELEVEVLVVVDVLVVVLYSIPKLWKNPISVYPSA